MRPAAGSSTMDMAAAAGRGEPIPFWSTPTPYLFIGFAVVMGVIAVALAVLLCSRRREEAGRRRGVGGEVVPEGMMSVRVVAPLDREAPCKAVVVVVAPGDDAPSFVASATPLFALAEVQRYYGAAAEGKPKVVDGAAAEGKPKVVDGAAV